LIKPAKRKIGVTFDWRGASLSDASDLARASDTLGYDSFWIPEAWGTDAFVTAAHVLGVTERINVATGIVNIYSRTPAVMGMASLSLLQISPGRFSLGLGVSGRAVIEDWHGTKFERPFERMREYVEIIRKVVAGEIVNYDGAIIKLQRFRVFTQIPETKNFRIYLAALGEKSLRFAGKVADGAIVIFSPFDMLGRASEMLDAAGGPKELVAMIPTAVIDGVNDRENALLLKKRIAFYISSMGDYYSRSLSESGYSETVELVRGLYRRGERDKAVESIPEKLLEDICLVGRVSEVRKKLIDLAENVTPVLALNVASADQLATSISTLKLLAPKD
jgi:alkanesulfonate monooxygenase SsuD/methylene tetrahydromethanopterin reductase-like flavin-dependent oxidoreductase (luciferase family)